MHHIRVELQSDVNEDEREQLIARLSDLSGVKRAVAVNPRSGLRSVRRTYYAYVNDEANIAEVLRSIKALPNVKNAVEEEPRSLS